MRKIVMIAILLSMTIILSAQDIMSVNAVRWNDDEWENFEGIVVINDNNMKISIGGLQATVIINLHSTSEGITDDGSEYTMWSGRFVVDSKIEKVTVFEMYMGDDTINYSIYWDESDVTINVQDI